MRVLRKVLLPACFLASLLLPVPPAAAGDAPAPDRLTVVTCNILAEEIPSARRQAALLNLLEESGADVIALQEVGRSWRDALLGAAWVKASYGWTREGASPLVPNGNFILSRHPIRKASSATLPGRQGRTGLKAVIDVGGRELAVATTHMESRLEDGPVRAKQLDALFRLLRDAEDAVLLGDLNFGDGEEPETTHLEKAYADLWLSLRPGEAGFTWNIEASEMARKGSFPGERSRRLDRILVRSTAWKPKAVRIIGDQPVTPGDRKLFPSDHFGVVGVIERAP